MVPDRPWGVTKNGGASRCAQVLKLKNMPAHMVPWQGGPRYKARAGDKDMVPSRLWGPRDWHQLFVTDSTITFYWWASLSVGKMALDEDANFKCLEKWTCEPGRYSRGHFAHR